MNVDRAARFVEDAYRLTELGWALIRLDGKIPKGKDWQRTEPLPDPAPGGGHVGRVGQALEHGRRSSGQAACASSSTTARRQSRCCSNWWVVTGPRPRRRGPDRGDGTSTTRHPRTASSKAARDGLELRLGPHQCVVPPSEHPDTGRPYVWELGLEPWSTPLLEVPADALAYFAEAGDVLRDRLQADPDAKVHPGQRRDQVFRLACSLVSRGVPPDAILTAARAFNETRCEPPLDDAQVVAQVDGAVERYPSGTSLSLLSRNVVPTLKPPVALSFRDKRGTDRLSGKACGLEDDPGGVWRAARHAGSRRRRGRAGGDRRQLRAGRSRLAAARRPARMRQDRRSSPRSEDAPGVWPLSSLTPQTLLSGFERKGKDKRPPASMLLQIGPFGILAFKDLTTVLTMHREARAQIIGQLREVADGRTEKSFGNGLRLEWEGKLGLVAGVTPVIDEQHAFLAVMGERFVLYRMPEVSRAGDRTPVAGAARARGRAPRSGSRRWSREFLAQFRNVGYLELPDQFTEPLITLADIVTRARSGVARDYQTRDILYLPEPEAPTRFAKQIAQLMAAAIRIGVPEERGLAARAEGRLGFRAGRSLGGDSPARAAGG